MDLRELKIQKFTYEELAEALVDLGFQNQSNEKYFIYRHTPTGAVIHLPLNTPSSLVKPVYYADIVFRLIWHKVTAYKLGLLDIIEVNRVKRKTLAQATGQKLEAV